MLFIHAERQALYSEYIHSVSEKARGMYRDIERDFLIPHNISIEQVESIQTDLKKKLRLEIQGIVSMDFGVVHLKLFRTDAMTLYDHTEPANEGHLYPLRNEVGFLGALEGKIHSKIEVESNGHRLMEAYLPIKRKGTDEVIAILESYEDVTRFEQQVKKALKKALLLPTIVFMGFNLLLFLIVAKADRIITEKTNLLVNLGRNMEKYLSQSTVLAICQAVTTNRSLFQGERQALIILFSDIRNFTAYSETTEPENVVQTLNRIFQIQGDIIHKHGGIIDKFVGDEVMVTFEAGHETDAFLTARDILRALDANPKIKMGIGIGIHSGEAVVGSIGTMDRRDYTAIGDTINIGARICAACPQGCAYISSTVFQCLPREIQSQCYPGQSLKLKGKKEPIDVHLFSGQ